MGELISKIVLYFYNNSYQINFVSLMISAALLASSVSGVGP